MKEIKADIGVPPAYYPKTPAFSMLAANKTIAYTLSTCKEYVLDCAHSSICEHVFKYKKIALDKTQIIVYALGNRILSSLNFVNAVEEILSIPPTVISTISHSVMFEADKRWMIAPPMLSLYVLLIRVGFYMDLSTSINSSLLEFSKKQNPPQSIEQIPDYGYIKQSIAGINHILNYGDKFLFGENMSDNWLPGTQIQIHNRGIVNYSIKSGFVNPVEYPKWYKGWED